MHLNLKKRIGSLIMTLAMAINGFTGLPVMATNGNKRILTDKTNENISNADMGYYNQGTEDILLMVVFAIIVGFLLILLFYFNILAPFLKDREYIKMEMRRNTGREYRYWEKELRRLYKKHIPIIGRFLK